MELEEITKSIEPLGHRRVMEHVDHFKRAYLLKSITQLDDNYEQLSSTEVPKTKTDGGFDRFFGGWNKFRELVQELHVSARKEFDSNLRELLYESSPSQNPFVTVCSEGVLRNVHVIGLMPMDNSTYSATKFTVAKEDRGTRAVLFHDINSTIHKYKNIGREELKNYQNGFCDIRFTALPQGKNDGSYRPRTLVIEDIREHSEDSFMAEYSS